MRWWPLGEDTKRKIALFFFGQGISLLITGTGITSSLLAVHGVDIPCTQSFLNYLLLCGWVVFLLRERGWGGFWDTLRDKWWLYVFLAACDVEANYLVVLAYQFTSLSSVMLLDCFSIPCVMLLGRLVLGHKFRLLQVVAVVVCVAGVVALVLTDWLHGSFQQVEATRPLIGDLLCLIAAVLYSISNTGQEAQVVKTSKAEYLGLLGLFGVILSGFQCAILEHNNWKNTPWDGETVGECSGMRFDGSSHSMQGLMLGFAVCLFGVYCLVPIMLERAGATYLNLSLLSSDVFAILVGIFLFNYIPSLLYLLSAVLIVAGLVLYNVHWERKAKATTEGEVVNVQPLDDAEASSGNDLE